LTFSWVVLELQRCNAATLACVFVICDFVVCVFSAGLILIIYFVYKF